MHAIHTRGRGDGHGHGQGHAPDHAHPEAPQTEGRLIRYAHLYDPLVWLMTFGRTRALRTLPLDLVAIRRGEKVLDVGCGTGDVALAAARRVGPDGAVWGIDASPEMIDVARRKAMRGRRAVRFQVEAVEALSFPDGSFDVVLSSLMIHHLPGDLKRRALTEIRRVLRPGGRVVIVDLQAPARAPRFWEPGALIVRRHGLHTASALTPAVPVLAELLREAGFADVEGGPTRYGWVGYARGRVPK